MGSEYEPLFGTRPVDERDLRVVRSSFRRASQPYLRSPWSWLAWALLLPVGALSTPWAYERFELPGALMLWGGVVLLGGVIEIAVIRHGPATSRTALATWVLRSQGNLSFVAVVLSGVLILADAAEALPSLWLLLLGHSFYAQGALALPAFRQAAWCYQVLGVLALLPPLPELVVFAVATAFGNLLIARAVWQRNQGPSTVDDAGVTRP